MGWWWVTDHKANRLIDRFHEQLKGLEQIRFVSEVTRNSCSKRDLQFCGYSSSASGSLLGTRALEFSGYVGGIWGSLCHLCVGTHRTGASVLVPRLPLGHGLSAINPGSPEFKLCPWLAEKGQGQHSLELPEGLCQPGGPLS